MREDNIREKLINYKINNNTFCVDQDAFNFVVGINFKELSYKYNLLASPLQNTDLNNFQTLYNDRTCKNKKDIIKNSHIIHFADNKKPWVYQKGYYSKLYKHYWKKALPNKEFPKLQKIYKRTFLRKIELTIRLLLG